MLDGQSKEWHIVVKWNDDIQNLTESEARDMFEKLKIILAEVTKSREGPAIELRQGPILRDYHEIHPMKEA